MIQYRTNLEQIPTTHNIMEREQMIQYHNTIPRLRRPTPRLGLSSFTACTSCSCRPLWNRCAKPASFCLRRPRYSPLCLPTQLYSQIIVRGRDSEPDGKPPPHEPMEGSCKSRKDNCRQCCCTLIAVYPYTSNRFACSAKTLTYRMRKSRPLNARDALAHWGLRERRKDERRTPALRRFAIR